MFTPTGRDTLKPFGLEAGGPRSGSGGYGKRAKSLVPAESIPGCQASKPSLHRLSYRSSHYWNSWMRAIPVRQLIVEI
jgi:hypothetical protein